MTDTDRESIGEAPNPLGLHGIEYIEYSTRAPQALGQVLETMGFKPVARHRSREILLYRQGDMNIVVNSHPGVVRGVPTLFAGDSGDNEAEQSPRISAIALRVRDARAAYQRALDLGGWEVPNHAQVMELNIPGIHGPGGAHLYFVDRWQEFSIYSIDFRPIPGVDLQPLSGTGLHYFGVVQYIGRDRTADWVDFYGRLFGFSSLPAETRFGVLPQGTLLQSPCEAAVRFYLQLIEPNPTTVTYDEQELYHRVGFGCNDVPSTVTALRRQGVDFVESTGLRVTDRGALTRTVLHSVAFELVHDSRP